MYDGQKNSNTYINPFLGQTIGPPIYHVADLGKYHVTRGPADPGIYHTAGEVMNPGIRQTAGQLTDPGIYHVPDENFYHTPFEGQPQQTPSQASAGQDAELYNCLGFHRGRTEKEGERENDGEGGKMYDLPQGGDGEVYSEIQRGRKPGPRVVDQVYSSLQ